MDKTFLSRVYGQLEPEVLIPHSELNTWHTTSDKVTPRAVTLVVADSGISHNAKVEKLGDTIYPRRGGAVIRMSRVDLAELPKIAQKIRAYYGVMQQAITHLAACDLAAVHMEISLTNADTQESRRLLITDVPVGTAMAAVQLKTSHHLKQMLKLGHPIHDTIPYSQLWDVKNAQPESNLGQLVCSSLKVALELRARAGTASWAEGEEQEVCGAVDFHVSKDKKSTYTCFTQTGQIQVVSIRYRVEDSSPCAHPVLFNKRKDVASYHGELWLNDSTAVTALITVRNGAGQEAVLTLAGCPFFLKKKDLKEIVDAWATMQPTFPFYTVLALLDLYHSSHHMDFIESERLPYDAARMYERQYYTYLSNMIDSYLTSANSQLVTR